MHISPQLLQDLETNPYALLETLTIKEIEQILKIANKTYHTDGSSMLSDGTYDIVQQYLGKLVPDHPLLQTDMVGAIPSKDKVKLPVFMGSLNKIRDEEISIQAWKKTYGKESIVSDKLDGISCLLHVKPDNVNMYSRGDGHYGQDIMHLYHHVHHIPQAKGEFIIRGELIISKENWKTIQHEKKNARNTVAGLVNSKKPSAHARLVDFVAYELIQPVMKPSEGLSFLRKIGCKVVHHSVVGHKELTLETLSKILLERRNDSEYEVDGIVVQHNDMHPKPVNNNPLYAFAFKSIITHDQAEVIVNAVQWRVSKDGLLKPVSEFEPVKLSGATIRRATAHNARMVEQHKLGPGSRVVIIRSGDVIPKIEKIISPSSADIPSFPSTIDFKWKWNDNHVEIQLVNPDDAIDYTIRQMENYVSVLGVNGLGPKIIAKLYHQGVDNIKKLVNVTKINLYKATYSSTLTMKIYNKLQDIYRKGTCVEFMVASNIFGAGMGKRKLQTIIEHFPGTLENEVPTLRQIMNIKGVGEKYARQFMQHLSVFHEFMAEVGLPCRSSIIKYEETPEGFMVLYGKVIVFTGFRSKDLEQFILKRGGKVSTSVSSSVHMVIAKSIEDQSIKSETAKQLGIPVLDLKTFQDEIGYVAPEKPQEEVDEEFEKLKQELDDEKQDDEDSESEDDVNGLPKKAECVRHTLNWADMQKTHMFGKSAFDSTTVAQSLMQASPKLYHLLEKIKQLDEQDEKLHKRVFKHMIFSDVVKRGYGAKIIASGLAAYGFKHTYNHELQMVPKTQYPYQKFVILAKTQVYTKPMTVKLKQNILSRFNDRPGNIQGEDIRIMVLDTGYKEGIDLYDVKYVHLFEPLLSYADEAQAIGRATRYCGQKGLHFEPKKGWTLHVYKYEHVLPKQLEEKYKGRTSIELIYNELKISKNLSIVSKDMEDLCKDASVDSILTKNMHIGGNLPESNLTYNELQNFIDKHYKSLAWPPKTSENLCTEQSSVSKQLEFSPSQSFIRKYFVPTNPYKGMLLWHSLGSGKTCTAIATASLSWEIEGYTIMWVTRGTLKTDFYKNVFDMSCMERVRDYLKVHGKLPEETSKKKRLLSRAWLPPISYKQLNNTLHRNNRLYDYLIKKNGYNDPFRKTIFIIDEAHLMVSSSLKQKEKVDVKLLQNWLHRSYEVSGKDSARILLMTATPIVHSPLDLVNLMNLTSTKPLPDNEENFIKRYLSDDFAFTDKGKHTFKNDVAGRISYLNITKDMRRFAQPVVHTEEVEISSFNTDAFTTKIESLQNEIADLKQMKLGEVKQQLFSAIEEDYQNKLASCEGMKVKEKRECVKEIKAKYKTDKQEAEDMARQMVAHSKEEAKEKTEQMKSVKAELKEAKKQDRSIATVLSKTCYKEKRVYKKTSTVPIATDTE